ncbi:Macrophage migration inhibitory factor homolog [Linum grandiflorum]
MPCLSLSTNVNLEKIDTAAFQIAAASAVADITGKPVEYVMVVVKGSVPILFGGSVEPAAYGELLAIGVPDADVNKRLAAAVSAIVEEKLSVPKNRFFLKFVGTKGSDFGFNGTTV